jgi:hypothetical protein
MWGKLLFIFGISVFATTVSISKAQEASSVKAMNPASSKRGATDFSSQTKAVERLINESREGGKLDLSPESKEIIVKEIIGAETYKGNRPSKMSNSESEANKLINAIASEAKGRKVTPDIAATVIAEEKIKVVQSELPEEIAKAAKMSGVSLTAGVTKLVQKDLLKQTERGAKSGLSLKEIRSRNDGYLRAIYSYSPAKILNEKGYKQVKATIFTPLIKLTIYSLPSEADVEISGIPIGKTTIKSKPFEPDKEYTFIFKRSKCKTSTRKYFITEYPPEQEFTEILIEGK